jgi:hypothetical protein
MRRKGMSKELLEQVSKEKLVDALMEQKRENEELQKVLTEVQSKGKKATEGELDDLQGVLANVMAAQVEYTEAVVSFDAEGVEIVSDVQQYTATPALLGVIEKFLKNNSILSDISTNENTETLQKAMARKTKRSDRLPTGDKIVDLMQQG